MNQLTREQVEGSFWKYYRSIPGASGDADLDFEFELWSPDHSIVLGLTCSDNRIKVVSRAWALVETFKRLRLLRQEHGINQDALAAASIATRDLPSVDALKDEPSWGLELWNYTDRPAFFYEVVDPKMIMQGEERQLKYENRISEYLDIQGIDLQTAQNMVRALCVYESIGNIFAWVRNR